MGNKKLAVIIAASGSSSRLGERVNISKQFVLLNGKPILEYSLEKFTKLKNVEEIIVVTNDINNTNKLLNEMNHSNQKVKTVLGGKLRQDSVYNGFCSIESKVDLVLIHDVARPLFCIEDVKKCIEKAALNGAAILAVPVVDTLKKGKSDNDELVVDKTINRDNLYQVQTPQVFSYKLLSEVYKCRDAPRRVSTDEAIMIELFTKETVNLVLGSRKNIKITYPEDLEIASFILESEKKLSKGANKKEMEKCLK